MAQRPVVWFTICWVAGSSASAGLTGEGAVLGAAALAAFLLCMLVLRLLPWRIAGVCMAAYGIAAGSRAWADAANGSELPDLLAAAEADTAMVFPVELAATIIQPVTVDGDRARFRLETEWLRLGDETESRLLRERLQVQVKLAEQAEQKIASAWRRGDRISLSGELKLPASASNFDGFDYRRYLHSHRIHWLLQVDGAAAVAAEAGEVWRWSYWLGRVDALRQQLGARLDAIYPEQHAGYMKGLVLGMRGIWMRSGFSSFRSLV
ncbi:ComEC/Rec2 family competence protein [Paenibacillus sp. 1P07SE]|uniref:ComEC/Rec2 family competence protein n=1 Tax=Paenibacillus sp. 1P07SE TaxID=3132209 RepID=UPI0039A6A5BE